MGDLPAFVHRKLSEEHFGTKFTRGKQDFPEWVLYVVRDDAGVPWAVSRYSKESAWSRCSVRTLEQVLTWAEALKRQEDLLKTPEVGGKALRQRATAAAAARLVPSG